MINSNTRRQTELAGSCRAAVAAVTGCSISCNLADDACCQVHLPDHLVALVSDIQNISAVICKPCRSR